MQSTKADCCTRKSGKTWIASSPPPHTTETPCSKIFPPCETHKQCHTLSSNPCIGAKGYYETLSRISISNKQKLEAK